MFEQAVLSFGERPEKVARRGFQFNASEVCGIFGMIIRVAVQHLRQRGNFRGDVKTGSIRQFLDQRLAARRPELTPEQRSAIFAGLRDYFQLCRMAGRRLVAMPPGPLAVSVTV